MERLISISYSQGACFTVNVPGVATDHPYNASLSPLLCISPPFENKTPIESRSVKLTYLITGLLFRSSGSLIYTCIYVNDIT